MVIADGHGCCCRCVIDVIKLCLTCSGTCACIAYKGRHILRTRITHRQAQAQEKAANNNDDDASARSGSPPKIIRNSNAFSIVSVAPPSVPSVLFYSLPISILRRNSILLLLKTFAFSPFFFFFLFFLVSSLGEKQDVDIPHRPASVMAPMHVDPDDNISYRIWIGTIVPVVPATIVTVMRFTARLVWQVGLWWDDYTIAVALVVNWAMAATRWAQILMYDYGQHTQFVSHEKVANFQKVCTSMGLVPRDLDKIA